MYRAASIAVVIPVFCEETSIEETILSIPSFVDSIIVIDDASTDATATILASLKTEKNSITLISHTINRGVGAALISGYTHALENQIDIVAVMAGDGQMDPNDLPALLDPLVDNTADYSKGNRFLTKSLWKTMPPIRIVGNIVLSLVTKITSGYWHVFDSQCGYTAITTTALKTVPLDKLYPRYGYPNDLLAKLHTAHCVVIDVPVKPIYGSSWSSGIRLSHLFLEYPVVLMRSYVTRLLSRIKPTMKSPS